MAASIRILLPLICALLVNAKNAFDDPFFNTKPFPPESKSNEVPHTVDKFSEQHSSNSFSYNSNQNDPFDLYHSYLNGGYDPYFAWPTMGKFGLHRPYVPGMNLGMPAFNNIFNIPGPNENIKKQGPNDNKNKDEGGKRPIQSTAPGKDPKSLDNMPPKTNLDNDDIAGKDTKQVDLEKKKDFLLVGSGGNGNNMFLLHENNPNGNPIVQPTTQPGNVLYVPYQPGQGNTPIYQVVPTPNNVPLTSQKQFVNPFSSAVSNLPIANNPVNQNTGYVLLYFNGQMIQIPGVILNPPQNNVQGTNVMLPNTMAVVQNPPTNNMYIAQPNQGTNNMYAAQPNQGTNNMYAAQPNQGTNPQYVVQMPGQAANVPGNQQNLQPGYQPNGAANGYYQPMTGNQGNLQNQPNNQNNPYQPMSAPISSGSNGYRQPNLMSNQGNNQGAGSQNPAMTTYPAVVLPMDNVPNGNQGNAMVNAPNHDRAMNPGNNQPSSQPSAANNNAATLDHNTLSNYGAIPAVMISGFKDKDGNSKNKTGSLRDRKKKQKDDVKINPK